MSFAIGNIGTNIPADSYKDLDKTAKVFGVKFNNTSATDGSQWKGTRTYGAKDLKFTPSTYSTTGVDEFCQYSPFNQKICAMKYNSSTGKQEIMAYSTDSDYATAVADAESNIMVEFSKFWYLRPSKYEFLISDSPREGFLPSPMHYRNGVLHDKVYVSKYELNHLYYSKSGQRGTYQWQQESGGTSGFNSQNSTVQTSQIHRTELRKKGMYVFDYASYCAILMLGLVKYGTLNWKTFIGYGNCRSATSSTGVLSTGGADSITTLDGGSTTDQTHAVLSFGIENLWGNTWKSIEGICQAGAYLYINTDIENLTNWPDSSMTGWTKCGQAMSTNTSNTTLQYISDMAYSSDFPWAMWDVATTTDATSSKVPDACWYAAGTTSAPMKIYTGGSAIYSSYVGPFAFGASVALARADWDNGVFAQSLAKP